MHIGKQSARNSWAQLPLIVASVEHMNHVSFGGVFHLRCRNVRRCGACIDPAKSEAEEGRESERCLLVTRFAGMPSGEG